MAFCTNCGEQIKDGTKFCANCGTPTDVNEHTNSTRRKSMYEGEIHKCPQCGEIIDAFVTVCPA